MDGERKHWERPRLRRVAPRRCGVAEEYLKMSNRHETPQATIEETQNTAYRVLGDYLRASEAVARNRPDASNGGSTRGAINYRTLAMSMFDVWTRLAETWLQTFERGMDLRQGGMPELDAFTVGPRGSATRTASPETESVSLVVHATRPVEGRINLRTTAIRKSLVAHALRATTDGLPPIPVCVEVLGDEVVVKVHVGEGQPSGTYHGLLIDGATEVPQGDVRVRILES